MAFFSLTRSSYALGWMFIAFYVILGHTSIGTIILSSPAFNAAGKLVFVAYLISPIIMMIVYSNTDHGVFMTLVGNMTLGMGHMFLAFVFGFIIYALIQWPIIRVIQLYIHPYVSHDDILKIQNTKL